MNYVLTGISVALIAACIVYVIRRGIKSIATFVLSGLILLVLLAQIGLDEYTRVQMFVVEDLMKIRQTTFWIQVLEWTKGVLILVLAAQVWFNQAKNLGDDKEEQVEVKQP